jgi:hypothetical protein
MNPIESTEHFTFADLAAAADQRHQRHIFSESQLRGELIILKAGDTVGPAIVAGNMLILGVRGTVTVTVDGSLRVLAPLMQLLVVEGVRLGVHADTDAAVELVWSPPFPGWSRI